MKISLIAITIILVTGSTALTAYAGEPGGARFRFAPNYWQTDKPQLPEINTAAIPHSVQNGAVPASSSFLGVEPQMLKKPTAKAIFSQAQSPSIVKHEFNRAFGLPENMRAQQAIVHNPPVAEAHAVSKQALPRVAHNNLHSSKSVHGVLKHKKTAEPQGLIANALRRMDSYDSGYVPGPYLPGAQSVNGMRARATVSGRILR